MSYRANQRERRQRREKRRRLERLAVAVHVDVGMGGAPRPACGADAADPARYTTDARAADCKACFARLLRAPQLVNALVAHLRETRNADVARALLELEGADAH